MGEGDDMRTSNEDVDRQDLKISLKIFLYSEEKSDLVIAVEKGWYLTLHSNFVGL